MPNRKWILTSLIMTFFGIPILAQFLAAVVAMLGVGLAGIIEVCNILIQPTRVNSAGKRKKHCRQTAISLFSGALSPAHTRPEKNIIIAPSVSIKTLSRR